MEMQSPRDGEDAGGSDPDYGHLRSRQSSPVRVQPGSESRGRSGEPEVRSPPSRESRGRVGTTSASRPASVSAEGRGPVGRTLPSTGLGSRGSAGSPFEGRAEDGSAAGGLGSPEARGAPTTSQETGVLYAGYEKFSTLAEALCAYLKDLHQEEIEVTGGYIVGWNEFQKIYSGMRKLYPHDESPKPGEVRKVRVVYSSMCEQAYGLSGPGATYASATTTAPGRGKVPEEARGQGLLAEDLGDDDGISRPEAHRIYSAAPHMEELLAEDAVLLQEQYFHEHSETSSAFEVRCDNYNAALQGRGKSPEAVRINSLIEAWVRY